MDSLEDHDAFSLSQDSTPVATDHFHAICPAEDGGSVMIMLEYPSSPEALTATLDAHAGNVRADVRALLFQEFSNGHVPRPGERRVGTETDFLRILLGKERVSSVRKDVIGVFSPERKKNGSAMRGFGG